MPRDSSKGSASLPPVLTVDPVAKRYLYRAYQAFDLSGRIGLLTTECEYVPQVNVRLSSYLPSWIRHPYIDAALVAICFRDAIHTAFEQPGAPDVPAYFATLIDRASLVLRYDLVDGRGRWDPLYGPGLHQWRRTSDSKPPATPVPASTVSISQFTEGMYHRLFDRTALDDLKRRKCAGVAA